MTLNGWIQIGAKFIPFTAQSRMSGVEINGSWVRKGAIDAILDYLKNTAPRAAPGAVSRKTGVSAEMAREVNALAESVIGLFKTEVIRQRGPWRNIDAVEFAVLAWVDWFNNRRLLEPLDYVPPAEYEAAYYQAQTTPAAVAGLN